MTQRPRTEIRRKPKRGVYDRGTINSILDEAVTCSLGIAVSGQPVVIPSLHVRIDEYVYVHGSTAGRTLQTLAGGEPACLMAMLLDGLVLARSAFHHSVNYRSVVVFGEFEPVADTHEKLGALQALTEKLAPGRWGDIRHPTGQELKATAVARIGLEEASAKVRSGPPDDEEEDHTRQVWAGVVPTCLVRLSPEADPHLPAGVPVPEVLPLGSPPGVPFPL